MDKNEQIRPGYWAVLPAEIRYDAELTPSAKLLYAELSALTNAHGYCYASNNYFVQLYGVDLRTVQRLLGALSKRGYIAVIVQRDEHTNAVIGRQIFCGLNPLANNGVSAVGGYPPDKNVMTPPDKNVMTPPGKNVMTPPDKNVTQNNININNIPPITPLPGGDKKVRQKSIASWKPERFDSFWRFYPRKTNKAAAVKAWDRLQPSDTLLAEIGIKLKLLLEKHPAWQDKKYMPHASTFLNGARWNDFEDIDSTSDSSSEGDSGWADDPEVF